MRACRVVSLILFIFISVIESCVYEFVFDRMRDSINIPNVDDMRFRQKRSVLTYSVDSAAAITVTIGCVFTHILPFRMANSKLIRTMYMYVSYLYALWPVQVHTKHVICSSSSCLLLYFVSLSNCCRIHLAFVWQWCSHISVSITIKQNGNKLGCESLYWVTHGINELVTR